MEDDLNLFEKGRRPNFFENRRRPQQKKIQPKTIKSKNNGCGTAPGNLVCNFIFHFSHPKKVRAIKSTNQK